ncbi:cache domain-containing sensor histidine kinase [Paenibacillus roseipurpureus]|uniref:histidine kinase n=1 Tax=Paenibacillus roseopurpureus TaxID=2918901 RepID=A0AA96LLF5_9BACL|nr:histidine kinase [Paenibacillus sp. MBLB1832]WNR44057.1 histidine kinase [Paenibacillus sp. MBLB1832]
MRNERWFLPLRAKFIILLVILIMVPFGISGGMTYTKYSADVRQNAITYSQQTVDQIRMNLDRYVKEMERLTLSPLYDTSVLSILSAHGSGGRESSYITSDEDLKMNLYLSSMAFDRSEIESFLVFTEDGALFSTAAPNVRNYWRQTERDWMDIVDRNDGGLTILPAHQVGYYTNGQRDVISMARAIREPYTLRKLGYIKVDLNMDRFLDIFSAVDFGPDSVLTIRDRNGKIFYPIQEPEAARDIGKFVVSATKSDYTKMTVEAQIPVAPLQRQANELSQYTLFVSVVAIIAAILIAILAADRLVKPIRYLQRKMRQVQQGDFNVRAEVTTYDEIGHLTEGFNHMVIDIERLVKEVYETKWRERDAELAALQSQLNPHFMYNTLETINMLAIQEGTQQISGVATNLGRLLRYTVDKRQVRVTLEDELRFVEAYLEIQSLREGHRLRTELHVDTSFSSALVPKLILQPLVENAIEHAMGSDVVTVRVQATVDGDDLLLIVEDNGRGMEETKLQALYKRMTQSKDSNGDTGYGSPRFGGNNHGYALRNLHQRLQLLYGEQYGVSMTSTAGAGARFQLRMPFEWEEQHDTSDAS